jgi:hypothetical protein
MLLDQAANLLVKHKVGGLPLMDGGKLVGIITAIEMLRVFGEMLGTAGHSAGEGATRDARSGDHGRAYAVVVLARRQCDRRPADRGEQVGSISAGERSDAPRVRATAMDVSGHLCLLKTLKTPKPSDLRSRTPSPKQAEALTVPLDDRAGLDQHHHVSISLPQNADRKKEALALARDVLRGTKYEED